jgi:hypothetical protein
VSLRDRIFYQTFTKCAVPFGYESVLRSPWGIFMSIETPAESGSALQAIPRESATHAWLETALTVLFTAATVLFVSFIAVVTGLV